MRNIFLLGIGLFFALLALACCLPANGQGYYAPAYGAGGCSGYGAQYGAGCSGMAAPMYAAGCSGIGYAAPAYASACGGMAMAQSGCAGAAYASAGYGAAPRRPLWGFPLIRGIAAARAQGQARAMATGCAGAYAAVGCAGS